MEYETVPVYSNGRMKQQMRTLRTNTNRETRKHIAEEANGYFALLEEKRKDPAMKRVTRILELLTTAERLREEIADRAFSPSSNYDAGAREFWLSDKARPWPDGVIGDCRFSDPITREMNGNYRDCLIELHQRLQRYHWRFIVWDSDYYWLQRFTVSHDQGKGRMEAEIVAWLLRFVYEKPSTTAPSQLFYFRKCRDCSRWFYAVTDHQHFCQASCRKHHASQSLEFREKRSLYMRERYRPQQKELQQRSIRNARGIRKGTN